jgi:chromosome segregation protein
MLKALELSGFKSFADKTRFEFPPGITVVVGPNGSGKSNIVDAIKWVLGEQSAKSLRGKEMSDVIFKGSSGANARRPANAAIATLVLDNSDRQFAFDATEVHVSRRVYRSGESEYLINGEVSRLKDIKDLFRGTGVGTDAYSLIEQGKVERMLQANPKDRRAIFEEAAGISRFKAKKIEAQRRLARVDGNLIRLADIVEEVASRYRSVKAQASKAARYKEHTDRLKELRTHVGRVDWQAFQEKLEAIFVESAAAESEKETLKIEISGLQESVESFEEKLLEVTDRFTQHQEIATRLREEIAQTESQIRLFESRATDLEKRRLQLTEQSERSAKRTAELKSRMEAAQLEANQAEIHYRESHDLLTNLESRFTSLDEQVHTWQAENENRRVEHSQLLSLVTQLGRHVSSFDTQVKSLTEAERKAKNSCENLELLLAEYQEESRRVQQETEQLQRAAESSDSELAQSRKLQESIQAELVTAKEALSELNHQHIAFSQRAEVIEELERSLEGVNAGAREILKAAQSATSGPLTEVVGLVADLISVNVQHAAIVDVALGELAQFVIVNGMQIADQISQEEIKLNGRIGLIQLNDPPTLGADPSVSLNGMDGVIGRADRLIQVQPEFQDFVRKLLGGTWIVKTLRAALKLHQQLEPGQLVRLVTIDGEIVEADGTVIAGPKSLSIGLISRRSELRALKREIERLDGQIELDRQKIKELTAAEKQALAKVQKQINQNRDLSTQLSDLKSQAKSIQENVRKTSQQQNEARSELHSISSSLYQTQQQLLTERQQLMEKENLISVVIEMIEVADSHARQALSERAQMERESSQAKVKFAKAEQILDGVQARLSLLHSEFEEHQTAAHEIAKQQREDDAAAAESKAQIGTDSKKLDQLNIQREEIADVLAKVSQSRTEIDHHRRQASLQLTGLRDRLRIVDERLHGSKMRSEQIEMQRTQLAQRLEEDYGIEISSLLKQEPVNDWPEREKIDLEIAQLRKRIGDIGSVNLDALQELEELESRYQTMDAQYRDLVEAKESLEKIIDRIDGDSRKLFVETLEAIRVNFQKLFRQTFGGGQADLILEEGVDPLEAGVEIVATPPGKSQFSNSLLSGGEKALTAVSLLMAIFQFRPSPFCVLDEVDAPFDEANIGRFIDVLKSFLGWTRFVIVTHSKKTMTAATTLYGITMQESGVSKRVSVRFEDVNEQGEISAEAVRRTGEDAA